MNREKSSQSNRIHFGSLRDDNLLSICGAYKSKDLSLTANKEAK